ncbi:hypothetical protein LOC68_05005 [Blastopirellula sp. JC732]|uniref:Folate-binding protein n=1 Tax=Blastopirellula sediminis TaxID=2894196 RepID=A0A9X1MJ15_9BACT|nr:glycine cleavage T C-terminal barrel domain-containing protein [Blastopirellula sediminis]MCC9609479.1 hypothetical protein [Blastopirellula sediminis]MCC9627744.1 hypothetical protein [Blastopirellula sediminis]
MSSTESRCDLLCFDLSDRTRLQLTGADRVKFLHNLSTNDIKKLPPQQGCEIFVPTLQGKILGHFFALPIGDSILLSGVPGQAETLLPHFQKYAVIEDVELVDRTDATSELLVIGQQAESWLAENLSITPPQGNLQFVAQDDMLVYRTNFVAEPAWSVIFLSDSPLKEKFDAIERTAVTDAALDALRIEAGFPYYGRDLTVDNLCQEAARDASAISFTKGCYLGQETIARIDALGHVNRRLLGVQFPSQPDADAVYEIDGKPVLTVTSTAYSPALDRWIGLAMVRRGFDKPGETLETSSGPVDVVALPYSA